jgi:hypothetical protein
VFTTTGTYPWSFVTYIFHSGQPSYGGDFKTLSPLTQFVQYTRFEIDMLWRVLWLHRVIQCSFNFTSMTVFFLAKMGNCWPIKLDQSATFLRSACVKQLKWAVMYVWYGYLSCLLLEFFVMILEMFRQLQPTQWWCNPFAIYHTGISTWVVT